MPTKLELLETHAAISGSVEDVEDFADPWTVDLRGNQENLSEKSHVVRLSVLVPEEILTKKTELVDIDCSRSVWESAVEEK